MPKDLFVCKQVRGKQLAVVARKMREVVELGLEQTLPTSYISCSVVSNSLKPHGLQPARLLRPWDSPGKNTGVGCPSLLQKDLPNPGIKPRSPHCRQIFYQWEAQEYCIGQPITSPADVPDPGIEPGSPALQANSLPIELSGYALLGYQGISYQDNFRGYYPNMPYQDMRHTNSMPKSLRLCFFQSFVIVLLIWGLIPSKYSWM